MPQEPVTHIVDMATAVDPIGENRLRQDVQQLFPDSTTPTRAVIRRAPIYNAATDQVTQAPELGTAPVEDPRINQPRIGHQADQQPTIEDVDLSDPSFEADLLGDVLEAVPATPTEPVVETQEQGYEDFAKQFEKYMGVPLAEAQATVQELTQFRQQVSIDQQMTSLANDWGVSRQEAEVRLSDVKERFGKLSQVTQNTLAADPVKSSQLIWAKLEQERTQKQQGIPTFDKSGTRRPPTLPRGAISKAEIAAMSNTEYQARQDEILTAYASGLVI